MSLPAITSVEARLVTVPLPRPWGTDVVENHFIAVRVVDADGGVGDGFSWTPTIGPGAVLALLRDDIPRFAIGLPAAPEEVWEPLWRHLHEAGGGGLTTIAMAGLDLALWDLVARREGSSVPGRIGIRRRSATVYGSGINRHLPLEELVAQAGRWAAAGYPAVKMKVGGRALADDLARVAAVREVLAPTTRLMVDANQLWTVEDSLVAARELEPLGLGWLEEPLRADDLPGYRRLAAATAIPLAAGENIHTRYRFQEFLDAGVLAVAQPNVVRVGGITPFLGIAADAAERGVAVHPHLLPELSGQLAMCLPGDPLVEHVEDSSLSELGVLAVPAPIELVGARADFAERPGLGLTIRTHTGKP